MDDGYGTPQGVIGLVASLGLAPKIRFKSPFMEASHGMAGPIWNQAGPIPTLVNGHSMSGNKFCLRDLRVCRF